MFAPLFALRIPGDQRAMPTMPVVRPAAHASRLVFSEAASDALGHPLVLNPLHRLLKHRTQRWHPIRVGSCRFLNLIILTEITNATFGAP